MENKITDNEIIKALKCCLIADSKCADCHFSFERHFCKNALLKQTLDLINRQKAEIERFKKRQKPTAASGYKIENGKVVFFTNMLGGCKIVKENLEEVVETLNELLHEAYSKDEILFYYKRAKEDLKTAKAEAIKEFAERLKEKCGNTKLANRILDDLVKEMVGEE